MTEYDEALGEEVQAPRQIETITASERMFALQAEINNVRESAIRELLAERDKHEAAIEQVNQRLVSVGYKDPNAPTGTIAPKRRGRPPVQSIGTRTKGKKGRVTSDETRARMRASQRARWEGVGKAAKKVG